MWAGGCCPPGAARGSERGGQRFCHWECFSLFHAFLFCLSYHLLFFYFFLAPPLFFSPLFSFLSFSFPFFLSPFFLHFFATLFLSFPLSFPLPPFFFLHSFHFSLLSYFFFNFPPSPQIFPLSPLLRPLFPSPFFTLPPPALTSPRAGQGRDRAEQPGEAGNLQVAPGMGEGGGGDTGSAPTCQGREFRTPSCFHPNGPCSLQSRRQESPRRAIYLTDFCSRSFAAASHLPARSVQEQLGQDHVPTGFKLTPLHKQYRDRGSPFPGWKAESR